MRLRAGGQLEKHILVIWLKFKKIRSAKKSLRFLKLGSLPLWRFKIFHFSFSHFFVFCHFSFDFSWLKQQIFWSREAMIPANKSDSSSPFQVHFICQHHSARIKKTKKYGTIWEISFQLKKIKFSQNQPQFFFERGAPKRGVHHFGEISPPSPLRSIQASLWFFMRKIMTRIVGMMMFRDWSEKSGSLQSDGSVQHGKVERSCLLVT